MEMNVFEIAGRICLAFVIMIMGVNTIPHLIGDLQVVFAISLLFGTLSLVYTATKSQHKKNTKA